MLEKRCTCNGLNGDCERCGGWDKCDNDFPQSSNDAKRAAEPRRPFVFRAVKAPTRSTRTRQPGSGQFRSGTSTKEFRICPYCPGGKTVVRGSRYEKHLRDVHAREEWRRNVSSSGDKLEMSGSPAPKKPRRDRRTGKTARASTPAPPSPQSPPAAGGSAA